MWRNETKADIKEREALAQQKYAKKLNSNPYWNPGKHQQTHSTTKAAKEYDERQALEKSVKEFEIWNQQRKEKEKQDFINKIASVQDDEKAFTPAELYEAGIVARKEGDGVEATMRLWQALICGDKRAAFPLFEILRDGEAGIPKNMEIARLVLGMGKGFGSEECRAYGYVEMSDLLKLLDAIDKVYYCSREFITEPNYKITDEILFEREAAANEVLDDFRLHTRAYKQPMLDVFQHPIIAEFEEKQEVHLTGNDEARHNLQFLLYIMTPNFCQPQKQRFATMVF